MEPPLRDDAHAAAAGARALFGTGPVALVLGGGGAKGAYQVGCWQALREAGVERFDAVAGTSVGALNAVLVAQDDFDTAQRVWREMRFDRVLRWHWHVALALLIRLVLFPVVALRLYWPQHVIPVPLWRELVRVERDQRDDPGPHHHMLAALRLWRDLVLRNPRSTDWGWQLALAAVALAGASAAWQATAMLLGPILFIVLAPFALVIVVSYAAWAVAALDLLATRFVLASNEPLQALLRDCVDVPRLRARARPVWVTLARLGEVTRPARAAAGADVGRAAAPPTLGRRLVRGRPADSDFSPDPGFAPTPRTTVEYLPCHFDLRHQSPDEVLPLVLQSAGLPELFPARRIGEQSYVDGGIVDNEPLAALVTQLPPEELAALSAIVVLPLKACHDEAYVRRTLAANLERLGRPMPAALPPLVVLTPPRPLGGFLTGTMGFTQARCRARLAQGRVDTRRALAARAGPPPAMLRAPWPPSSSSS
jgi:hypothetical protein